MPAFVIAEIDVDNPLEYNEHKRIAHATVTKHHGRYLVAGGSALGADPKALAAEVARQILEKRHGCPELSSRSSRDCRV